MTQNTIFKQLKNMSPVTAKPAAKDENLKKLKSEIEMIITNAKNYSYKSPVQEFEEHLVRDFNNNPDALTKIKIWVLEFKAKNPYGFTTGKNYNLNYDALVAARESIRLQLAEDGHKREESERREREMKEAIRLEKARIAREKKEEERRKKPWLKSNTEKTDSLPFKKTLDAQGQNLGFSMGSAIGTSRTLLSNQAFKDTGRFAYDKTSGVQSPFGATFGENEIKLPWEEEKKEQAKKIKIKDKNTTSNPHLPKSAKMIVRELVSKKTSNDNTLNKSGSEYSVNNKRLVPLSYGSSLAKSKLPPSGVPDDKKRDNSKIIDDFLHNNYSTNK